MSREYRDREEHVPKDAGHEADRGEDTARSDGMSMPADEEAARLGLTGTNADRDGGADGSDGAEGAEDRIDGDEAGDDNDGDELPPRRTWIRNFVIVLVVLALIANALAFLPRLFNLQTLPLLSQSRELSGREDVRRLKEAVVQVGTDNGKGSGFHVSDGYTVTNYHVIDGAAYIIVEFSGIGKRFAADVAGFDPDLDLAVLRVDGEGEALPAIEIERERGWSPGDRVYVIGNPLALKQIAVEGEIAGTLLLGDGSDRVMAVDAPIHPGNSGSPVINEHGRAIAVIYAVTAMERGDETRRVGLAVPLREPEALLSELRP